MKNSDKIDLRVFKPHPDKKFPTHTRRCVACNQPFTYPEATCFRCGTCQHCETITTDRFGNECIHCHNSIDKARHGEADAVMVIHHSPSHETDDHFEPRRKK